MASIYIYIYIDIDSSLNKVGLFSVTGKVRAPGLDLRLGLMALQGAPKSVK